jgi:peptidoglycan/LPS O-acetylase OafA/YrhL
MLHLDALRFIAAMAIMVLHFSLPLVDLAKVENLRVGVDIFFVISGYVIATLYGSKLEYRTFLRRRFARLAPLHVATALAFAGFALMRDVAGYPPADVYDFSCFPQSLLLLSSLPLCKTLSFNIVSWSISAEAMLYAAFPLFVLASRQRILLALFIVTLLAFLFLTDSDRPWYAWTRDWGVLRGIPSFALGVLFWACRSSLARLPGGLFWPAVVLMGVAIAAGVPGWALIVGGYATVALAIAADQRRAASPLTATLAPLGTLTYSIYMLHFLILTVGTAALKPLGLSEPVIIALLAATVLPASYLSLVHFEQPMRKWLGNR